MTTPDRLGELAERIEAAPGPDRKLDREIFSLAPNYEQQRDRASGLWAKGADKSVEERRWAFNNAPNFTASLDAAMTLVDNRALWAHGCMEDGPFARLCWPMPNGGFVGGYHEATAATVPLAICAAALRARIAQGGDNE